MDDNSVAPEERIDFLRNQVSDLNMACEDLRRKKDEACALGKELGRRLSKIGKIIEHVNNRCMAADGPVTPTLEEMTQAEISEIYELTK